jgi:hypothetical protein
MDDWYRALAADTVLPPDVARQLNDHGFVVVPDPDISGGLARLAYAYDRAMSTADPRDVSVRSSTRVHDFVNRGPEFDGLYVHRWVLAACCLIIGRPFKLSALLARTTAGRWSDSLSWWTHSTPTTVPRGSCPDRICCLTGRTT